MNVRMPARLCFGVLERCSTASREYAVLKTFHGGLIPLGGYDVEILCDVTDAELLDRAKHFYPEAMP